MKKRNDHISVLSVTDSESDDDNDHGLIYGVTPFNINKKKGDESNVEIKDVCHECKQKESNGDILNISWVCCDICNSWFHYNCVGLKNGELLVDEEWYCHKCSH